MGFFSAPKPPAPVPLPVIEPPPPAPTVDNSAEEIRKAQELELERLKKQKGRAATILNEGEEGKALTAKALLGS